MTIGDTAYIVGGYERQRDGPRGAGDPERDELPAGRGARRPGSLPGGRRAPAAGSTSSAERRAAAVPSTPSRSSIPRTRTVRAVGRLPVPALWRGSRRARKDDLHCGRHGQARRAGADEGDSRVRAARTSRSSGQAQCRRGRERRRGRQRRSPLDHRRRDGRRASQRRRPDGHPESPLRRCRPPRRRLALLRRSTPDRRPRQQPPARPRTTPARSSGPTRRGPSRPRRAASTSPTTPSSSTTATAIISNQEDNDTIVEIAYPSGRVLFQYGHPRTPGAGRGYLDSPDDTYLLRSGGITVADSSNCRVVILDPRTRRVVHQIGTLGPCIHAPPTALGSPNGDTPLADGNLLISEINGSWIDEYTPRRPARLGHQARDRLPLGPPAARPRPLPRRRLRESRGDRRVRSRRPHQLPLPAHLGNRAC